MLILLKKPLRIALLLLATAPFLQANDRHTPSDMPELFARSVGADAPTFHAWKLKIKATVFWVGERPTAANPVPNCQSSWDMHWTRSYGGYDNPRSSSRKDYRPKAFEPKLNPFYVALPYNDVAGYRRHKKEASKVIPWFSKTFKQPGQSVCKGRWLALRFGDKTCYAQWEDCGPFRTNDWKYVFGDARPATKGNGGVGIDVSPAVRDYLGMKNSDVLDWRFVEIEEIAAGPWRRWGQDNHFVHLRKQEADEMSTRVNRLHRKRSGWMHLAPRLP